MTGVKTPSRRVKFSSDQANALSGPTQSVSHQSQESQWDVSAAWTSLFGGALWVTAWGWWVISWSTAGVLNDQWGGWFGWVHGRPWGDRARSFSVTSGISKWPHLPRLRWRVHVLQFLAARRVRLTHTHDTLRFDTFLLRKATLILILVWDDPLDSVGFSLIPSCFSLWIFLINSSVRFSFVKIQSHF